MPPSTPVESPWWVRAFGAEYLAVYGHRDDAEATRHVPFLRGALGLVPHARVLDVGCGEGRYARALSRAGMRVTGFDLSEELLAAARARSPGLPGAPTYVRGDMRELPFHAQFDAAVSLFSSFGYFDEASDDAKVLEGVARALVPGGRLLVDVANGERLRRMLVPASEERRGHLLVRARRRLDDTTPGGPYVRKHVALIDERTGATLHEVEERVRLYGATALDTLLEAAGLVPTGPRHGDLEGSLFTLDAPRLVRVAERPRGRRAP